jgi:molybdopterin-containing oxidoreductase family iron-sulfur binding subunit
LLGLPHRAEQGGPVKTIDRRGFLKIAAATGFAGCAPIKLFAASAASKRWAMIVDLKKCREKSDCTICISACHKTHNVPDFGNIKDEVTWIWKDVFENAFPEQVHEFQAESQRRGPALLMCNHCDNPPCVSVCPTQATWKRATDGLVMMDWHRCIGCRYCMAACPYSSRSFNWRDPRPFIKEITSGFPTRTRGVVEKCNFCEERLADSGMPACVQACPANALTFGDLRDAGSRVKQLLQSNYSIRRRPGLGTQPQVYYLI